MYPSPFYVALMESLIGVEIHNGQAKRVVLHHSRIDVIGKREPNGHCEILAANLLLRAVSIDNSLKVDQRFVWGSGQVGDRDLAYLRFGLFDLSSEQFFDPLTLLILLIGLNPERL